MSCEDRIDVKNISRFYFGVEDPAEVPYSEENILKVGFIQGVPRNMIIYYQYGLYAVKTLWASQIPEMPRTNCVIKKNVKKLKQEKGVKITKKPL